MVDSLNMTPPDPICRYCGDNCHGGCEEAREVRTRVRVSADLLQRLEADGGRYLLSIAMTPQEIRDAPEPTYGGKGKTRWLTDDERDALIRALETATK